MVTQAEHTRPPRRDAGGGGRRWRTTRLQVSRGSSTTRTRRNAPPGPHDRHADGTRIRRNARAPRGRRRLRARKPAAGIAHAGRGGGRIPPTRLDDATLESLVSRMRNPDERGDLRAQLAGNRLAETRRRALRAPAGPASPRRWTSSWRTRSASCARRSASSPTDASRALTGSRRQLGLLDIRAAVTIAGDARHRLHRHRAAARGQLNCPLAVTRSACFYVVLPHRP